jgi:nucleoside-diphosphate-sugar epimerase
MRETDILVPNSYYSATKGSATLIAQSFAILNSKPIAIVRPFSVFGPYEEENRLIPIVIKLALSNKAINLTSKTARRDFIYVKDIAAAFLKIANSNLKPGEIINLGTGKQSSNYDVVKIIGKILNQKLSVMVGTFPKKPWDSDYWVTDTTKTSRILHWNPKYSLENGLKETIAFYKNKS